MERYYGNLFAENTAYLNATAVRSILSLTVSPHAADARAHLSREMRLPWGRLRGWTAMSLCSWPPSALIIGLTSTNLEKERLLLKKLQLIVLPFTWSSNTRSGDVSCNLHLPALRDLRKLDPINHRLIFCGSDLAVYQFQACIALAHLTYGDTWCRKFLALKSTHFYLRSHFDMATAFNSLRHLPDLRIAFVG